MSAVYKSICNEADTFLLLVTKLAEREIQLKLDIEKLMNKGFINIAKARYIMGSTCVTKMQLPTENSNPIQPLATVFRKKINNSWVFQIGRKNCSNSESAEVIKNGAKENSKNDYLGTGSNSTSINSTGINSAGIHSSSTVSASTDSASTDSGSPDSGSPDSGSIDSKYRKEFIDILQNDPKSLKKSKNAFLIEDNLYQSYNDEYLDKISDSDSVESLVSVTDPMRLFGILVPKAMKQAQLIFNNVVNLLGECATVQYQLNEALHKYYHLENVKRLIEAAAIKMKFDVLTPKVYWTPTESSTISCYSEESEEGSQVSVTKSVRSVFYESDSIKFEGRNNVEQEAEFSLWDSSNSENESNN